MSPSISPKGEGGSVVSAPRPQIPSHYSIAARHDKSSLAGRGPRQPPRHRMCIYIYVYIFRIFPPWNEVVPFVRTITRASTSAGETGGYREWWNTQVGGEVARVVKHAEFLAAVSDTQNGLIKGSHTGSESRGKLTAFRAAVEKNIFLSFHFPSSPFPR